GQHEEALAGGAEPREELVGPRDGLPLADQHAVHVGQPRLDGRLAHVTSMAAGPPRPHPCGAAFSANVCNQRSSTRAGVPGTRADRGSGGVGARAASMLGLWCGAGCGAARAPMQTPLRCRSQWPCAVSPAWARRSAARAALEVPCAEGSASPFGGRGSSRSGPALPQEDRSEEHTSELQSRENLVCRLLLEK